MTATQTICSEPRMVQVRTNILKKNDHTARALRQRFTDAGVWVVGFVSAPGTGKTELLERTLTELQSNYSCAALVGDLATENDADRLSRSGAQVRQIVTNTTCHLEAHMVEEALGDWDLRSLDFLFIENVGNLVCPSGYDLGEHLRVVLFATTEGEDKPRKYPTIFNTADIAMITKTDLADAVGFDRRAAHESVHALHPGMSVLETSARTGDGMAEWINHLEAFRSTLPKTTRQQPAAAASDGTG